jgi:hypothetical protein
MIAERQTLASRCGAPAAGCRMMIMSGDIASRLRAVSTRDSPLETLLPEGEKFRESAESRFSAISKEERVRVEGSMKKLTMVRPLSVGTFLMGRCETSRKDSAVSRMSRISSGSSGSMPSRCLWRSRNPASGVIPSSPSLSGPASGW